MEKERFCTYAKGEPASSLRSQPGRKDGEGWVEDSTGVVGCLFVDGMRRGRVGERHRGVCGHGHRQHGKARVSSKVDIRVVAT